MARVVNGFLGDAIGKLGNVIFRKWNALVTASQYQPEVKNPNTPKQQEQRTKIKNLSHALQPFKDSVIPLNFTNRKGLSTSWAEAIRKNYPLLDEIGNIEFMDMILSGGTLVPPVILEATYDPFINQFYIKYKLVNQGKLDLGLTRLTAIGRMMLDDAYNVANICKLPYNSCFSSYINELDLPDWPLNFIFDNAWSEGMFFYNIVRAANLDVRAYNPRNISNTASAGAYFNIGDILSQYDFSVRERIIMPENIHASIVENEGAFTLKIYIDPFDKIPGLLAEDIIIVIPKLLEQGASQYSRPYSFAARAGEVSIPLQEGHELKPFNILYYVTDNTGVIKSTATRFSFNHPDQYTYCELLFLNGFIHPDSVKIHKPYTAIWGDLKDFIPLEFIGTIPYKITSKNQATGEERQHVINRDNLFMCSKLFRNQLYIINIGDGEKTLAEFEVIGLDDDYEMTTESAMYHHVVKFKAGADLSAKVK
jgi:hypothetical protein